MIPAAILIAHEIVGVLRDQVRFLRRGAAIGPGSVWPSSMRCIRPPTRISKNSSRLRAVIARNFTRSNRGLCGFSASSSTRRLNASHEASRFNTKDGSCRERLTIERRCFTSASFSMLHEGYKLRKAKAVGKGRQFIAKFQLSIARLHHYPTKWDIAKTAAKILLIGLVAVGSCGTRSTADHHRATADANAPSLSTLLDAMGSSIQIAKIGVSEKRWEERDDEKLCDRVPDSAAQTANQRNRA